MVMQVLWECNSHLKQEENWKIIPLLVFQIENSFISSNQTHSAEPQIKKNCHLVLERHPGCHQPKVM